MMVPVQGAELFYSTRGVGPPVLVLCSFGTAPMERQTPPALSDRLKLIYVDPRGSGRSTGEPADLTFDVLAQDLEAVRLQLGLPRVAVLGHSILGALAIEYSRRCPDTVTHVIAVGTPPHGDMARLTELGRTHFQQHASEERQRQLRDNLAALPPGAPPGQALFAQTPMRFYDARFDATPLFADAQLRPEFLMRLMGPLTAGWDVTQDARPLRVPIFLALGRHDYIVPHVAWDDVASTLPTVTTRIFEQSGHQAFFEEPVAFATAVTDWMNRPR